MTWDVSRYTDLITPEHQSAVNFMAMVAGVAQPFADSITVAQSMSALYDLNVAVGEQLDRVGQWIGATRYISVPIMIPVFSFDVVGQGFDQAPWAGGSGSGTQVRLEDDAYRTLLRAKILNNHWDGSVDGAYAIWDALFVGTNLVFYIKDWGDLSMTMYLVNTEGPVDTTTKALFQSGQLNIKPAGIRVRDYIVDSAP